LAIVSIIMTAVNGYLNVMKQKGNAVTNANPNSEMSLLKRELIEHYKNNPLKAYATINAVSDNTVMSDGQRAHYEAACIAVGKNNKPTVEFNFTPGYRPPSRESELNKLSQAGWKPLINESKPQILCG